MSDKEYNELPTGEFLLGKLIRVKNATNFTEVVTVNKIQANECNIYHYLVDI